MTLRTELKGRALDREAEGELSDIAASSFSENELLGISSEPDVATSENLSERRVLKSPADTLKRGNLPISCASAYVDGNNFQCSVLGRNVNETYLHPVSTGPYIGDDGLKLKDLVPRSINGTYSDSCFLSFSDIQKRKVNIPRLNRKNSISLDKLTEIAEHDVPEALFEGDETQDVRTYQSGELSPAMRDLYDAINQEVEADELGVDERTAQEENYLV